jgi:hypothetical protein
MEEVTGESAERPDELAGIGTLESGLRELQEKFLEGLVRLRRIYRLRISRASRQWAPIA